MGEAAAVWWQEATAPRRFPGPKTSPGPAQDERRGRQSGGVGLALGILNNPTDADGNYNFNFAMDGMEREESGQPGNVEGGYSYTSPEGELVSVEYVADEFGFHPVGSHIPVAPPMPPHVRRLLFSVLRSKVNCLLSPKTAVEVGCLRLVARSVVVVTWAVV